MENLVIIIKIIVDTFIQDVPYQVKLLQKEKEYFENLFNIKKRKQKLDDINYEQREKNILIKDNPSILSQIPNTINNEKNNQNNNKEEIYTQNPHTFIGAEFKETKEEKSQIINKNSFNMPKNIPSSISPSVNYSVLNEIPYLDDTLNSINFEPTSTLNMVKNTRNNQNLMQLIKVIPINDSNGGMNEDPQKLSN